MTRGVAALIGSPLAGELSLSSVKKLPLPWYYYMYTDPFPDVTVVISRVAPDIISGPGPAEIWPNFHIRPRPDMAARYEVVFDHLSMHLPHCVIGQEFIVLQIR